MACGLCEHCQGPVTRDDSVSLRGGYSYHKTCHKCYVCSETDLSNAEIFKGVIFCSSCAKRIFQGCSTARQAKTTKSKGSRPRRKGQRNRSGHGETTGVIELAGLVSSSPSDKTLSDDSKKICNGKPLALPTDPALQEGNGSSYKNAPELKKTSVEMGTTTNVTQILLSQIECKELMKPARLQRQCRHGNDKNNKTMYSDLRIAELGASTEIANMALRKKSELPVIIKSELRLHREESISLSMLKRESDISEDVNENWIGSQYSTLRNADVRPLMDRHIGSILRLPYNCFKRNILNRSSLISVLMSSSGSREHEMCAAKKLKLLFQDDIIDHQKRGMSSLYSTINRRRAPYRMGWLNLMVKMSRIIEPTELKHHRNRCRHFRRSHSYRCMRSKVMRLAGPTKSELATFRVRMKNAVSPPFVRKLIKYNKKYAIMMSRACGRDKRDSVT